MRFVRRTTELISVLLLGSCGYIGPVLPPALDIPQAVPDLRVAEIGDKIVAEFTIPALTTEGLTLKTVRSIEVRVGPGDNPFSPSKWAASAKAFPLDATAPGAYRKDVPADQWIGKVVVVGVRAVGPKGKPSPWSTKVLAVEKPLEKPAELAAKDIPTGVQLTWKSTSAKFRIFRATGELTPERMNEVTSPEFNDETTQYGTKYQYFVQIFIDDEHQSELSDTVITPKDSFPPAVPGALTAEPGVSTIELAWTRNTEPDFKGYNVYRSVDGGPFEKIADAIPAPAFSDNKVEKGKRYRYAISAIDLVGNESSRSNIAEAVVQ